MDYYVKSVVPIIESNYANFTTLEKTIADYFIHNQKRENFSAKSVAERIFVSEASLSRFARKCGYRGYREFIYQYEETFLEKKQGITDNSRMALNAYQELLNKSYSLINEGQIERIVNYLNKAERVYVCGKGSSGLAAEEMSLRFMRIGVNINSVCDSDRMRMQAVLQNEKSLIIGISISAETRGVLYFLSEAGKHGAKTILLTARNRDALYEFCDEVVLLPSLKLLNHGNVISPQFPILVMVDIIYAYYVKKDKLQKESLHDDTLRALEEGNNQKAEII